MTASTSPRLEALPDLVTVEQFAAWAGIGRNQAYAAVHNGEVRSVRLGRSIRIPRAALEELVLGADPPRNEDTPAAGNGEGVVSIDRGAGRRALS
jgi:excisionase family DNA binding protein